MLKLFLDEDVPEAIATALRLRGYDVMTVKEAGRKGIADVDQLKFASSEKRVLLTFNIADFYKIHSEFIKNNLDHSGIILSKQLPIRIVIRALLKLLSAITPEKIGNNVIWLTDWVK
jgi:uncharacterized protein with PIN domain